MINLLSLLLILAGGWTVYVIRFRTGGPNSVLTTGECAIFVGLISLVAGWIVGWLKRRATDRQRKLDQGRVVLETTTDLDARSRCRKCLTRLAFARELILGLQTAVGGCLVLIVLFTFRRDLFSAISFEKVHVEWFLMVGWGVAIVGAIWALLAKFKADLAFEQARSAAEKSEKAYFAVTTKSRAFHNLVTRHLENTIEEATDELLLLLGSPFVGFFKKEKDGSYPYVEPAKKIAHRVQEKFRNAPSLSKMRVIFFDWQLCERLAKRAELNESLTTDLKSDYAAFTADLRSSPVEQGKEFPQHWAASYSINGAATMTGSVDEKRKTIDDNFDPGIRIAISKNAHFRRAYVWFVEGFVDDTPSNFKSVAVETEDPTLIDLLELLVDEYARKLNDMLVTGGNLPDNAVGNPADNPAGHA